MKVILLNGSANAQGCTYTALSEMVNIFEKEGIEAEIIQLGGNPIRDCIGCGGCRNNGNRCVFDGDIVNEIIEKAEAADGMVFGTPVYYAHPSGRILSALDRVFYAGSKAFAHKPGMAVASARRAGTTASLDALNKYFAIAQMPMVPSTYWNMVHGTSPEEVKQDEEGLQIMRNAARNMAWLLKCMDAGKNNGVPMPQTEATYKTNFIR